MRSRLTVRHRTTRSANVTPASTARLCPRGGRPYIVSKATSVLKPPSGSRNNTQTDFGSLYIDRSSPPAIPITNTQKSLAACPYKSGCELTVLYTPEGSDCSFPLQVEVLKAFTPFTVSQSLLVEPCHHALPRHIVIKLADPRFSDAELHGEGYRLPWSAGHDSAFHDGIRNVQRGIWPNFWERLGGVQKPFEKRPFIEDDDLREGWIMEMDHWDTVLTMFHRELRAYRVLRPLQGTDVPLLFGTCSFTVPNPYPCSLVERVNGICMEYIDGTSMDRLKLNIDISEADALRISPGILDLFRRVRDLRVLHGDIAHRNIILRRDSLRPVLIDFGAADVPPADMTWEAWTDIVRDVNEVGYARRTLSRSGWHNPSPSMSILQNYSASTGYAMVNGYVENIRPDWRAKNFDKIEDLQPEVVSFGTGGKEYRWQPLKWRVKEGVKLDTDYQWMG
ncbi:hypothetical protein BV25DRAFT_1528785 [Artomyces pyxidatus]|uniref:Uncharacterized protein n=1 Tax=Artomyces pyxidatus TaxID=48021 RepID=A0ACB8TCK5_9AGAM|nr:hypothetical protein BV25DRAFT_1528785 [Artomyces pyxidatus]